MSEIGDGDLLVPDHAAELPGLLVGPLEELLEQAQLVEDLAASRDGSYRRGNP